MLDLRERRRVDQQEAEAALLDEHLAQVLDPLAVRHELPAVRARAAVRAHGLTVASAPTGAAAASPQAAAACSTRLRPWRFAS